MKKRGVCNIFQNIVPFGEEQESTQHDVKEQIMTLKLESCKISDCALIWHITSPPTIEK